MADVDTDPGRIDQVSGFYGPGAWASWVVVIIWSWLAIMNGEMTLSHDSVAHLLYTNWAAVDLLRQLKGDATSLNALTAALIATYWGLVNHLAQYAQIVGMVPKSVRKTSPILLATVFTMALSSIALSACTIHLFIHEGMLGQFQTGKDDDVVLMNRFTDAIIHAAMIGSLQVALVGLLAYAVDDGSTTTQRSVAAYTSFLLGIAVPFAFVLGYTSVIFTILPLDVLGPHCLVWKPCTGLSLSDWNQVFAPVCALIVRETGVSWSSPEWQLY